MITTLLLLVRLLVMIQALVYTSIHIITNVLVFVIAISLCQPSSHALSASWILVVNTAFEPDTKRPFS